MKNILSVVLLVLLNSCSPSSKNEEVRLEAPPISHLSGMELATVHCSRCHAYVEPELLPKESWQNDVLPSMGHRMGMYGGDRQPDSLFDRGVGGEMVRKANIYPENPTLAQEDWQKIIDFYVDNALDSVPENHSYPALESDWSQFTYTEVEYAHRPALTVMVNIGEEGLVFSDIKQGVSNLTSLGIDGQVDYNMRFRTTPIHVKEKADTLYVTTAGKSIFPHDAPEGDLQKVYKKDGSSTYDASEIIIADMHRPVFMTYADLNNDGLEDVLACEYGNNIGRLAWYEKKAGGKYEQHVLSNQPGAIHSVVKDIDGDGLQDIVALMAQGKESVLYFQNKGDGNFEEKQWLSFSPLNGSQHIDIMDFNGDGFDDILYVCGDNADKTPILKTYHGIYIFLNDGNFNFESSFFYPLNGAYKALARDYDEDGDLDIAAISFFPDYVDNAAQSFVYLENTGNLEFKGYTFPQSTKGRWMVMDAGDVDSDGDIDLALGSFVYFEAMGDTTGLGQQWFETGPSVVILENNLR